jgi:hypothetical protein
MTRVSAQRHEALSTHQHAVASLGRKAEAAREVARWLNRMPTVNTEQQDIISDLQRACLDAAVEYSRKAARVAERMDVVRDALQRSERRP